MRPPATALKARSTASTVKGTPPTASGRANSTAKTIRSPAIRLRTARAVKQVDDHHYDLTVKKAGKVTVTGKAVIAADGKSRTVTVSGTDAAGEKVESIGVYDKQ